MVNINDIEESKSKRQNIRLPKWYRVVRFVRRTQVPKEFRAVFDIESDPQHRNKNLTEKVAIANDKAEAWMKGGDIRNNHRGVIPQHPGLYQRASSGKRSLTGSLPKSEDV